MEKRYVEEMSCVNDVLLAFPYEGPEADIQIKKRRVE